MHPRVRCHRVYTYIRHERKYTCRDEELRSKADICTMEYDSAVKSEEHRSRDNIVKEVREKIEMSYSITRRWD